MPCDELSIDKDAKPYSDLSAHLIERNYKDIGCDQWNARKVQLLCAKLGDTPRILGARLRLRPADMDRRMETDCWTRQDGLLLTLLEREVDFQKGGKVPTGKIVP